MDIKDRLKIARDIQDKCLVHKIDCEVKTTFYPAKEWKDDNAMRHYHDIIPYVSIWIYPNNKSESSFSLYLWNYNEDIKELYEYKYFMNALEKLIKKCD